MKIGIVGCAGRMGRALVTQVVATEGAQLVGGTERPHGGLLGKDMGTLIGRDTLGAEITNNPGALFEKAQVVIDFTTPAATRSHLALAMETGTALVIGTTGLSGEDHELLAQAAEKIALVQAPNMSVGVTVLTALTRQVAALMGPEYDIEVLEMHHRHKVDAPSGTALGLGQAAAEGRGVKLDEVARTTRDGHTGPRPDGEIGFATLRGGDVIGDHTVIFASNGERLELTHKASDRTLFARGAVLAAMWLKNKDPGHYSMFDVLGL
ncbi:4-hydroxy-tetrahydrodipicolinate reductase [Roseospirillum parvum]|uniref:4-hydroxy-tetrahydrodipicolinate reductase n=1 Tax=Roseospirillum parvum TaxID=83401 RepID=A0A1G7WFR9_9PROT|nr:4-hydroxy-tetrahydrodipicolinate reductase [Roseospirillum parvum]SDG70030.1 4-hydroxy-tetrahydrodipicolinate reductase [Roseospirillum parvum]